MDRAIRQLENKGIVLSEEYKTEYKAYIEALDRKALEAIKRIKELVLAKAQAKEEDAEKINQDINALFKFNSSIYV